MSTSDDDKGGSYDDWQSVAKVSQVYEAELIALRLQEAGIEAQVIDQSFEQIPLSNVADFESVRVLVPNDKVEEAQRILSVPVTLPDDAEQPVGEPEVPAEDSDKE
jgi:hypothetical protein